MHQSYISRWLVKGVQQAVRNQNSVLSLLQNGANKSAADYIRTELLDSSTLVFSSKQNCQRHFFSQQFISNTVGLVLDFGVHNGKSTLQLGDGLLGQERVVWGFDAFEGIRDSWSKTDRPAGSMTLDGKVPPALVDHPKIEIVVGWVEDTLPDFLEKRLDSVGLVHFDMDVFIPTRFALEAVKPRLNPGAIIVFDDYFGFIGWENHSHRAMTEVFSRDEYVCLGISPFQAVFLVA